MRRYAELIAFVLALLSYWTFAPFIQPRELLFELINGLTIALVAGAMVYFVPNFIAAVRALKWEPWTGGMFLAFSVIVIGVSFVLLVSGNLISRLQIGTLDLWVNSLLRGFLLWALALGYAIKFMSRDAIEGVPSKNWLLTGMIVSAGLLGTYLAVLYFGRVSFVFD